MAVRRFAWGLVLGLVGCGPSNPDPLLPPGPLPSIGSEPVVVCPAGSTYDNARQVCIAVQEVPAQDPKEEPRPVTPDPTAGAAIRVACGFSNGWVSVMPVAKYPRDDQFLMQALIGLTDEPSFWMREREYAKFATWKAKKCGSTPIAFDLPKGAYFILAGEANTFQARGDYKNNGYKLKVDLDPGSPTTVDIKRSDLTHTWLCISCPWVAFFDPRGGGESEGSAEGAYLPSFVVLKGRRSKGERGADRVATAAIPVKDGRVKLRVIEAEHEVTHLDRLALEIGGETVLPSPGKLSALASDDGVEVEMARGRMIEVTFEVPGIVDGTYSGAVIAAGYYEPVVD